MEIRSLKSVRILILFLVICFVASPSQTFSKSTKGTSKTSVTKKTTPAQTPAAQQAPQGGLRCDAQAAVLMDAYSGQVLYEQNPHLKIPPASFVKVMTLYLVFDALRAGTLKMEDMVTVSEKAWRTQGSKMFIGLGDRVKVEDLLKGIAISSGNDSSIALVEHMAGSEEAFVSKMNEKAKWLGLKDTQFKNSHGMPADGQYTTAMDMAILCRRYLEDHPESLAYHSTTEFTYNKIRQYNRNTLLLRGIGVDGVKTGHVEESGFHLAATAKRDGQRMIAVVMGCDRMKKRATEAQTLLEYGFKNFSTVEAVKKGAPFGPVKVRRGKENKVSLTAAEEGKVTVPKGKESSIVVKPEYPPNILAPVQKGQVLAKVFIESEGKVLREVSLVSPVDIPKSFLPSWPVLLGVLLGFVFLVFMGFWWRQRLISKKFRR